MMSEILTAILRANLILGVAVLAVLLLRVPFRDCLARSWPKRFGRHRRSRRWRTCYRRGQFWAPPATHSQTRSPTSPPRGRQSGLRASLPRQPLPIYQIWAAQKGKHMSVMLITWPARPGSSGLSDSWSFRDSADRTPSG